MASFIEIFRTLPDPRYLRGYLKKHGREVILPVTYNDLSRITYSLPIKDKYGNDTHWEEARHRTLQKTLTY